MENTNINQEYNSTNAYNRQLKMSFETEMFISADDSVRYLSEAIDSMNLKCIERNNAARGRKFIIPENIFLKILVYGYMNKQYSSRAIERACTRDINFMWLLNGYNAPSHNTIALFRKSLNGMDSVFSQLTLALAEKKELD